MKRGTAAVLGITAVLAAGVGYVALKPSKKGPTWRTAKVERGGLRQRISATGTLSGLVQVNVGTQVSGTISALYVDYNSQVKKDQPVAQIDPTLYETAVQDAQATVSKAETAVDDTRRQLERAKRLFSAQLISDQDLQDKDIAFRKADADLGAAKAALAKARTNLGYTLIKAPVSGVVVSRSVDVGQTVAASFSTPTLFVIAQDLTKMKLEASIDEADIGQVQQNQPALFTVDSYPDTQFRGRVNQVRLEPITANNVVTYKVVIQVDNDELKLRPGMTANVTIQTQSKDDVLKVPSAALRFNPIAFLPRDEAGKGQRQGGQGGGQGRPAGQGQGQGGGRPGGGQGGQGGGQPAKGMVARREDRIWVMGPDGRPKPIPVKAGITDGQATEISGEGLEEGMTVLVGVEEARPAAANTPPPGGGGMRR